MYFYDNCFSMMFLSDFWLQPCMNRWFAEMKSYQRRQAWFLCNWFFYFYASWANRVSKNSFRRLVYIVGAHFIYCWITILYIVGAHLYLMLEHIFIHCINRYPCILGRLIYIIWWHFYTLLLQISIQLSIMALAVCFMSFDCMICWSHPAIYNFF